MSFEYKRQNYVPYGRKASSLTLEVKDKNEQVIDYIKLEKGKDLDNDRRLKQLKKYGFNLKFIQEKEEVSVEEEKKKDVDWLKKDIEW